MTNRRYELPAEVRTTIREGEANLEGVKNSSTLLLTHLKELQEKVQKDPVAKEAIESELEEVIDHIDFDRQLADGTIPEYQWNEFDIEDEDEIVDMFNGHLNEMFDLFDTSIGKNQKFCFLQI